MSAPVELVLGDLTEQSCDALVNAANSSLLGGGGVDGAIHRRGGPEILAECRALRETSYPDGLPVGDAVATTAGRLPARWVIHTVGPVYRPDHSDPEQLRSCYVSSLRVAAELGAASVAFPLISAGAYGWPIPDALDVALGVLVTQRQVAAVRLVLWQQPTFEVAQRLLAQQPNREST